MGRFAMADKNEGGEAQGSGPAPVDNNCGGWWFVRDGFPIILACVFIVVTLVVFFTAMLRSCRTFDAADRKGEAIEGACDNVVQQEEGNSEEEKDEENDGLVRAAADAKKRQNTAYKRGGAVLLFFGALAGFGPSISLLCYHGYVWSVDHQDRHTEVDGWLIAHMVGAITWAIAATMQLITGGVRERITLHRAGGWVAATAAVVGVAGMGGFAWTIKYDFDGTAGGTGAGIYTVLLGVMVMFNVVLLVVKARRRDMPSHKDHALLAIFWTMDPAVHRLCMWLMRLFCWNCWAPEYTNDKGIGYAKQCTNLILITWGLITANAAGRLNATMLGNIALQFVMWLITNFFAVSADVGLGAAAATSGASLAAAVAAIWAVHRAMRRAAAAC